MLLAELTTLRLGGPPAHLVTAETAEELVAAVRKADERRQGLLVLGGGSNVVVADTGFPGTVVQDVRTGVEVEADGEHLDLQVPAGTPWEDVVERAVGEGWAGLEALTGIPGSAGATPVQNVGAYGQEVATVITAVRVWDRAESRERLLKPADLGFGYRTSVLKRSLAAYGPTPRHVVLEVRFRLRRAHLSQPIGYPELADRLGVGVGDRAPLAQVREAVLELRRGKGMVLDPADHDTWSAGSFFTNPVLPADRVPEGAPRWAVPGGAQGTGGGSEVVKTSAAWLIQHAGFGKGYGLPGPVSLSTKHVLALTNRGSGTTTALLALAREVRDGVRDVFGVRLEPEPVLVGTAL